MSATQESDAAHETHEGPIKTPKQLVLAVVFAFVVPIAVIIMLATSVSSETKPSAGTEQSLEGKAVLERIAPVASVEVKDAADPNAMKTGEQVFQSTCSACHAAGALGAPKFGDAAAWGPRIGQGFDALLHSALHGKGNMPAQGGGDLSDFEVARAVVYMADHGGAKFDEPKFTPPEAASAPN
ncbi:MAG: cytochrome c5 family protein [Pelomonas sp.]|nr:cytochrome c5 family protein [Roseateles sp.]